MKAIITDLDRTLLHTDKSVSDETVRILKECKGKGIAVVVATARPERSIQEYQEQIGFDALITLNGARTVIGSQVLNNSIPKESVMNMVRKLEQIKDAIISLETNEGLYANREIPLWNPIVVKKLSEADLPDQFYKVIVSSESLDLHDCLNDIIDDDTYYSVASGILFQIMSKSATKWNGISDMLKSFGIDSKDVVYFGDDNDDIESIERCGTGVAVENAIAEVKEVADIVIKSNDDDGVAEYIKGQLCLTSD